MTLAVMMSCAVFFITAASPARARTTSRSDTMPEIAPLPSTTTTAPMRWRASVSTMVWTLSEGETVMTSAPLCLRI